MAAAIDLTGMTALVTGAAGGIGRGCAIELAHAGADIVFNDREAGPETDSLLKEISALGCRGLFVAGDAFSRSGCEAIVAEALQSVPSLEILISNPAFSRRGDFLDYDPELFHQTIDATLAGGFHMAQLVGRHLVQRNAPGKIVFISSVHASIPYARSVAYNAAKSGLDHMARTIAAELARHRINVNVIQPGWIETPGEHKTFGAEAIREAGSQLPWGRIGQPEDIGRAAAFLCSPLADYITGACLPVDGGFLLRAAGI